MIKIMRKNMKIILWIVVVAFVATIFLVWGMDAGRQSDYLAEQSAAMVNGEPISYQEFDRLWSQRVQSLYTDADTELTEAERRRERMRLIDDLIDRELMRQAFEKLGLAVYDEEIAAYIAADPKFRDEGRFSRQRYLELLRYNRMQPETYEAGQRRALALLKLERFLRSLDVVTDRELQAYFLARQREIKLALVPIAWRDLTDGIRIGTAEAREYFDGHKSEFEKPRRTRASHILIRVDVNADEEAKLAAKLKAENLRQDLAEGADFAALAREHSDDPGSATEGGDLGYFSPGMMVSAFEEAAFALEPGEISQPVETPFGYHLIKVTDHQAAERPTFTEVRDEIVARLKEQRARELARDRTAAFRNALLAEAHVAAAADATGERLVRTAWIRAGGKIPGLANDDRVLDRALDLARGVPRVVAGNEQVVFVEVLQERWPEFDAEAYAEQRDELLERYRERHADQIIAAWLEAARERADIVNNLAAAPDEEEEE